MPVSDNCSFEYSLISYVFQTADSNKSFFREKAELFFMQSYNVFYQAKNIYVRDFDLHYYLLISISCVFVYHENRLSPNELMRAILNQVKSH